MQACQLCSESQDFTTDLKFSLLCCKYSLHVHLATCAYTKTQVEVLIVIGEAYACSAFALCFLSNMIIGNHIRMDNITHAFRGSQLTSSKKATMEYNNMQKLYVSVLQLLNNCMMHNNYRVITIYRTCLKIFCHFSRFFSQDFSAPISIFSCVQGWQACTWLSLSVVVVHHGQR